MLNIRNSRPVFINMQIIIVALNTTLFSKFVLSPYQRVCTVSSDNSENQCFSLSPVNERKAYYLLRCVAHRLPRVVALSDGISIILDGLWYKEKEPSKD